MGGKGSGRPIGSRMKIDPFDPNTWPAGDKRRLEREMQLRDILIGNKVVNSPKAIYLKERMAHLERDSVGIALNHHMMDTIADIQAMHKLGAFRFLPLSVREVFLRSGQYHLPFDSEEAYSENPKARIWNDTAIVKMSLEVLRLYLMGLDPYTSRVIRSYLSVDLHKVGVKKMTNAVERVAEFQNEYEDDDDFDFSTLGV